jgi:hypothetical protein
MGNVGIIEVEDEIPKRGYPNIEYRCNSPDCTRFCVRPVKGTFRHPHFRTERTAYLCPQCKFPVYIGSDKI